jgi:hypothetical protein
MDKKELEREAEEYALDTYEMCVYQDLPYANDRRARIQAFLAGAEPRERQIAELKEINAGLKEQNRSYEQLIDTGSVTLEKERLKNYKQLTKAKELLSRLKSDFKNFAFEVGITPVSETYFEVEKFLKEIE